MHVCTCLQVDIASLLSRQGNHDAAIAMLRPALIVLENVQPYSQETAGAQQNLKLILGLRQRDEAERLTHLPVGTRVRVNGLISRSEWNGRGGTVLNFDAAKARYGVRLDDGKEASLKTECITPLPTATPSTSVSL